MGWRTAPAMVVKQWNEILGAKKEAGMEQQKSMLGYKQEVKRVATAGEPRFMELLRSTPSPAGVVGWGPNNANTMHSLVISCQNVARSELSNLGCTMTVY